MGRHLRTALALCVGLATLGAGQALAAKPTVVRAGNEVVRINGGVAPRALPRRRLAPISLNASANLSTVDGSQPPATRTVTIDFDKHGAINARGLPACRPAQLEARPTKIAEKVCGPALVGKGSTTVRVQFAESPPFASTGRLLLFNGGVEHGVTTIYVHAYVNVPVATALVTVVRIHRIHKGPYGTRAIATIPKIAGGAGSVIRFNFHIHRLFRRHGRRQSYLLARCANGRLRAHATLADASGGRLSGTILRPCRPQR
jgi:hypothetical protein